MMPLLAARCRDIQVSLEYLCLVNGSSVAAIMSGNKLQENQELCIQSGQNIQIVRQRVDDVLAQAQRLRFEIFGDHPAAISKAWFS